MSVTGTGTASEVFVHEGESIQEAVTSSLPGDVIIVKPGIYSEHINVTQNDLIIRSESGNPGDTVIEAYDPAEDVFTVHANNVTLKGFTVTGAGTDCSGLYLYRCNDCLIDSNKFVNNYQGIYLNHSLNNKVVNNVVLNGGKGIAVEKSGHNSISRNKVSECGYGISILKSKENRIYKNTVQESKNYCILLLSSNSNTLSGNRAFDSSRGIHFGNSDSNTLTNNTVSSNEICGLFVCPRSDENLIYNNYFNNTLNIEANNGTANAYSRPKTRGENIAGGPYTGGNCWVTPDGTGFSETAVDADKDGIADESYEFETSDYFDPLPLLAYKSPDPVLPEANMSINTPESYASYSVQFTDLSENEIARSWDFENDGIVDSSDEMPVHTYPSPGTYFVSLTVSNANGTDIETTIIDVEEDSVTEIQPGSGSGERDAEDAGSQAEQSSEPEEVNMLPGFEMIYGIFCLVSIFLYKESRK
ncbi:NosD domain-containing protein [Methanosarcina hadiensis]|uniref:NosD domain-containing protein n=1 Tax=Methanosarcina hadiensis TaxID=3078083 RepID=UPI0039774B88